MQAMTGRKAVSVPGNHAEAATIPLTGPIHRSQARGTGLDLSSSVLRLFVASHAAGICRGSGEPTSPGSPQLPPQLLLQHPLAALPGATLLRETEAGQAFS